MQGKLEAEIEKKHNGKGKTKEKSFKKSCVVCFATFHCLSAVPLKMPCFSIKAQCTSMEY